jgi:hypothetical protein
MGFVPKESMDPGEPVALDAPTDILHTPVFEHPCEDESRISVNLEPRKIVLRKEPCELGRETHGRNATIDPGGVPSRPITAHALLERRHAWGGRLI